MLVPLAFTDADTRYDASIRLCFARAERLLRRAALVVRRDEHCWSFEWSMRNGRPVDLVIHPDSTSDPSPQAALHLLAERLAALGLDSPSLASDDSASGPFDGFSSAQPMDIMQSVQEEA